MDRVDRRARRNAGQPQLLPLAPLKLHSLPKPMLPTNSHGRAGSTYPTQDLRRTMISGEYEKEEIEARV